MPFSSEALVALLQVVMIDLVLAGDNAIVIGLAAAGLPQQHRTRAIVVGILAATLLRILFAGVATQLLQIVGLLFAGGILLLWVCWNMLRELRASQAEEQDAQRSIDGLRHQRRWNNRRTRRPEDIRASCTSDRCRRRIDVIGQCPGGCRGRRANTRLSLFSASPCRSP